MSVQLTIIGLGPGCLEAVTLGAFEKMKSSSNLLFRTGIHPVVQELTNLGIKFSTFDYLYEKAMSFDEVYDEISRSVIKVAQISPVVYAVPGHPLVGEESVNRALNLAKEAGIAYEVLPAMSFLDPLLVGLQIEMSNFKLIDGLKLIGEQPFSEAFPEPLIPNIIMQVYNSMVASEVKLSLMKFYPDEHPIKVVRAVGLPNLERVEDICLYELDRLEWIDHLTCIYVPPYAESKTKVSRYPFDSLVDLMEGLRDEGGCPWDREQTHESLKKYLVEETYEVLDAIDEGNMYKVCEELGDLLLQIAFHAQIARENGFFDINDVTNVISEKIIRRHPHVFGNIHVENSAEVSVNWEEIKKGELQAKGEIRQSLLDGIPKHLPALMKADKIQRKAAKVGFEWPDYTGALDKVTEEIEEVKEAISLEKEDLIRDEIGDLLFASVNLSRMLGVNPEDALLSTVRKFRDRFVFIEKTAAASGVKLEELDLEALDKLWEEAKVRLKS